MRPLSLLLCALSAVFTFSSCGKSKTNDAHASSWTPVLGTCKEERQARCFLSDQVSGMIWSKTHDEQLLQKDAAERCRRLNMRLPSFREYALAAQNGMLKASRDFPGFGDAESLLWTNAPDSYIAFGNHTATKRQGTAPARFKCVTGDAIPSLNPPPASRSASQGVSGANRCSEHETLNQCGASGLCVWTHRGCLGIEGILEE